MKILCEYTPGGPHFVRNGWANTFKYCGYNFKFWNPEKESAFDAFNSFSPDVFLGTSYGIDRAVYKCVASRPNLKVGLFASAWSPFIDEIDKQKYPIVVTTDQEKLVLEKLKKETGKPDFVFLHSSGKWLDLNLSGWASIGIKYIGVLNAADVLTYLPAKARPELACDWFYAGNRWPFKARNLDRFILPMCHPSFGLKGRICGTAGWEFAANWIGTLSQRDEGDAYSSALVCPSISEPHSTDLGFDFVERSYKTMAVGGGIAISDYVQEGRDLFTEDELPMAKTPEEYHELIRHFVKNPEKRTPFIKKAQAKVLKEHTYFNRVANMLETFGLEAEAKRVIQFKYRYLNEILPDK